MNRLMIVADDLTGACDSAAYVADCGINTEVIIDIRNTPQIIGLNKVAVINTQTRTLDRESAYSCFKIAVSKVVKQYCESNTESCVCKKIDTAYRGNVGIEIQGMLEGLNKNTAFIINAIPSMDRITLNGYQIFDGKRINETDFINDPLNPVKEAFSPDIIKNNNNLDVEIVALNASRSGEFLSRINNSACSSMKVYVFDALTQYDIEIIISQLFPYNKQCIWVGSLGLMEALVKFMFNDRIDKKFKCKRAYGSSTSGKIIGVSGSAHASTSAQIKVAEQQGILKTVVFDYKQLAIMCDKQDKVGINDAYRKVVSEFRDSEFVFLLPKELDRSKKNEDIKALGNEIVSGLSEIARCILRAIDVKCLVLVGGETSFAVFKNLGIYTLKITGSIETAVVKGYFDEPVSGRKTSVILKGGSVGNLDSIIGIYNYIAKE